MEHDPKELRKMEEGKALLKELLGHTPTEVLAGVKLFRRCDCDADAGILKGQGASDR